MPSVNLITLGCPKNTVDSERMHRLLECNDYVVAEDPDNADIIVVKHVRFHRAGQGGVHLHCP